MRFSSSFLSVPLITAGVLLLCSTIGLGTLVDGQTMAFSIPWYAWIIYILFFPGFFISQLLYAIFPEPAPLAMFVCAAISSWIFWSLVILGALFLRRKLVEKKKTASNI